MLMFILMVVSGFVFMLLYIKSKDDGVLLLGIILSFFQLLLVLLLQ